MNNPSRTLLKVMTRTLTLGVKNAVSPTTPGEYNVLLRMRVAPEATKFNPYIKILKKTA